MTSFPTQPSVLVRDLIAHSAWQAPSNPNRPRVSILLPTYSRGASGHFRRCVESLLTQTYRNFELLIVDDASTDGTADQIAEFVARDNRIGVIRHPRNVGLPAVSSFEAYQAARGELFFFAFDDNQFYGDALDTLVAHLDALGKSIIYGHMDFPIPSLDGRGIERVDRVGADPIPSSMLISHNYIPNSAVLAHRRVFEAVGWYDPHIVMSRLCDWDLWRRVVTQFELTQVDISVGQEFGPLLANSLGNSRELSSWAVEEWMRQPGRNATLNPARFADYDVLGVPPGGSTLLKSVVADQLLNFRTKYWFPAPELSAAGPILVVTSNLSAPLQLHFFGLNDACNTKLRVVYSNVLSWREAIWAQAVIFVEDLLGIEDWIVRCTRYNIPCYLFLGESGSLPDVSTSWNPFQRRKSAKTRALLSRLSGLLLSTERLVTECRTRGLHPDVSLYPPIRQSISNRDRPLEAPAPDEIRFAYLGGAQNRDLFCNLVLPALSRLSDEVPVKVYCADIPETECGRWSNDRLTLVRVDHDHSYVQAMQRFMALDIHVLVHPAPEGADPAAFAPSVLINGATLHAAVVASGTPSVGDLSGRICRTARNDVESWTMALRDVARGAEERARIIAANDEFCRANFSGRTNEAVLSAILARHPYPSVMLREQRFMAAIDRIVLREREIKLILREIALSLGFYKLANRIYRFFRRRKFRSSLRDQAQAR